MADDYPDKLDFCYWGNSILRHKADRVLQPDSEETADFIERMKERLTDHDGLGLAANQVSSEKNLCLVMLPGEDGFSEPVALVNPEILEKSEETELREEGCLSFPEIYVPIERPKRIKVRAHIPGEGEKEIEAEGIGARVICHEVDHLNGIVIIDHISYSKRSMLKKKLREIASKHNK